MKENKVMKEIKVNIEYKNIKTMNLRVMDNNTVLIRANPRYTQDQIMEFVEKKRDWILKQLNLKHAEQKARSQGVYVLGKNYAITYISSTQNECKIVGEELCVYYKTNIKPDDVLYHGLYQMVKSTLKDRLDVWMACFPKLAKPKLSIQSMKSRWGSCKYRESEIILNAYLIHVPISCIDYVIVHELMHFYYPDHQKGFHGGMKKVMPDYLERRKMLREYEFLLRG